MIQQLHFWVFIQRTPNISRIWQHLLLPRVLPFWWSPVFSSWMMPIAFRWVPFFLLLLLYVRKLFKWKSEHITSLLKSLRWFPASLRVKVKSPPHLDHSFCPDFTIDHLPPCSFCFSVALMSLDQSQHTPTSEPVHFHPPSGTFFPQQSVWLIPFPVWL